VPFLIRLPYATDMGYEKLTTYMQSLFPDHLAWLFALAAFGFLASLIRRVRIGIFLSIMAILSALLFRIAPQARLWNARILPFWFLCLYLLAGVAVAEWGSALVESFSHGEGRRWGLMPVPVVALAATLIWVSFPLRILPFGHLDSSGRYKWLGLTSTDKSFIPDWVNWNYTGYESAGKARRNEYFGLINTMSTLGKTNGCGRAMWEYEPELDQMGTPMALMLLPYWTQGCIGSMEGLYFESSATTPYHFLDAAELSLRPSNPVRGLNYGQLDVAEGVQHLQMLGVKYYMALTPQAQAQADADSQLQLVATSGPWKVSYPAEPSLGTQERTWKIYEIASSDIVSPLVNQPAVMTGVGKGGKSWLRASEDWYNDPTRWPVYLAASGPSSWARVPASDSNPPQVPLDPVQVSNIRSGDDHVSFDVDTVGVPVLVKVSYFPNWTVSGAKGPYRVTPNLMVVIPTSHHVRLHYGYTPVDFFAMLLTFAGIVGVALLWRLGPVSYPAPAHRIRHGDVYTGPPPPDVDPGGAPVGGAGGAGPSPPSPPPAPYAFVAPDLRVALAAAAETVRGASGSGQTSEHAVLDTAWYCDGAESNGAEPKGDRPAPDDQT
jgi:hypothetical protein